MSTFRIFNSIGVQVFSSEGGSEETKASDRHYGLIKQEVPLFVDLERNEVVASFVGDTPTARNRKKSRLFAVYEADDRESLFTGLVQELDEVGWEVFKEEARYSLPWLIESANPQSPAEIRVDGRFLMVIREALSNDALLNVGAEGYQAAARILKYFVAQTNDSISIAISAGNGRARPDSLTQVGLVLVPGPGNFDLLNDESKQQVLTYRNKVHRIVQRTFEDPAISAIDTLIDSDDVSVWQTYSELRTLHRLLADSEPEFSDLETSAAKTAGELVVNLRTATTVDDVDPTVIDAQKREAMEQAVHTHLEKRLSEFRSEMQERVRSEYKEVFGDLGSLDLTLSSEVAAFRKIRRLLEDETVDDLEPAPQQITRFQTLLGELEENEVLTAEEREEVAEDLRSRVDNHIAHLVQRRENWYRARFERDFRNVKQRQDTIDSPEQLREFTMVLESISRALTNSPLKPGTDVDEIREFLELQREISTSDVLRGRRKALLRDFKKTIQDYSSNRRKEIKEDIIENTTETIESLAERRSIETAVDVYYRLQEVQDVIYMRSRETTEPQTDEDSSSEQIDEFREELYFVRNHPLLTDSYKEEIFKELRQRLNKKLTQVHDEEKSDIIDEIDRVVGRIDEGEQREQKILELKEVSKQIGINRYRDSEGISLDFDDVEHVGGLRRPVKKATRDQEAGLFDQSDVSDVEDEIEEKVKEKIRSIQRVEQEKLEEKFEQIVEWINTECTPSERVRFFRSIRSLKGFEGNVYSEPISDDEEEVTSVLRRTTDRSVVTLSGTQQRKIRNQFEDTINNELKDARADLAERLEAAVREAVTERAPTSDGGINSLKRYVTLLETVNEALGRQTVKTDVAEIDEAIQNARELLTDAESPAHGVNVSQTHDTYQEFKSPLSQWLADQISATRGEMHSTTESVLLKAKEAAKNWSQANFERDDKRMEAEIKSLMQLRSCTELNGGPQSPSFAIRLSTGEQKNWRPGANNEGGQLPSAQELYELCRELPNESRERVRESINECQETLTDQLATELEVQMLEGLRGLVDSSSRDQRSDVGATILRLYIEGKNEDRPTMNDSIDSVGRTFDRLVRLKEDGTVDNERFEGVKEAIVSKLKSLEGEPNSPFDRVKRLLPNSVGGKGVLALSTVLVLGFVLYIIGQGTASNLLDPIVSFSLWAEVGGVTVLVLASVVVWRLVGPFSLDRFSRRQSIRNSGSRDDDEAIFDDDQATVGQSSPAVELKRPVWGETVHQAIEISANTDGKRYTVTVLDGGGTPIKTETGRVDGRKIDVRAVPENPGSFYVLVSVETKHGTTTTFRPVSMA